MSTPNQTNWPQERGRRWANFFRENQGEIVTILGCVFIGLICFALGRLTAGGPKEEVLFQPATLVTSQNSETTKSEGKSVLQVKTEQIQFVASKSGSKYHWPWCSFAERIKEENRIYFGSEQEAQAAGYSRCSSFAKQAPAGYLE